MVVSIVMAQASGLPREERNMWLIELNIAGHRFTRHVPDKRRQLFGRGARALTWRGSSIRPSSAA